MYTQSTITRTLLTIFFFIVITLPAQGQTDPIEIEMGKDRVLKVGFDIERAVAGNPAICRPEMKSGGEVLIRALQPGETNIHIFGSETDRKEFRIIVTDTAISPKARELKRILGKIQKVKVDVVGRKILVHGEVYKIRDLDRVKAIVESYPEVISDVVLSPIYYNIIAEEIKTILRKSSIRRIKVTPMRNKFVVEGIAPTAEEMQRVGNLMQALSPNTVNAIRVVEDTAPMALIKMNIKIMEVERNALKDYGIHWNPGGGMNASGSYSASFGEAATLAFRYMETVFDKHISYSASSGEAATLAGSITSFISNLFPKMRKIEEAGRGRTVFNQDLLVRSGGQGSFFRGKEVPFLVAQRDGIMSTEFKKIGVTLDCTPVLISDTDISTAFKISASRIVGPGPGGAPVIASNDLGTDVIIPVGQSVALGGAVGQMELQMISGSPPSKGYSLFQLNKADRNETKKSEVIILVTPQVFRSSQEAAKDLDNSPAKRMKAQELQYMREQLKNRQ